MVAWEWQRARRRLGRWRQPSSWALRAQGHEVRLMPAQYVKPYVKTNKSDYIDAEAIAEAVGRPKMRFVPIKSDDQLDLQSLHRVRERWVMRRTAVINQIRMACCSNVESQYARGDAISMPHCPLLVMRAKV